MPFSIYVTKYLCQILVDMQRWLSFVQELLDFFDMYCAPQFTAGNIYVFYAFLHSMFHVQLVAWLMLCLSLLIWMPPLCRYVSCCDIYIVVFPSLLASSGVLTSEF